MKKSELRQLIREEIQRLTETLEFPGRRSLRRLLTHYDPYSHSDNNMGYRVKDDAKAVHIQKVHKLLIKEGYSYTKYQKVMGDRTFFYTKDAGSYSEWMVFVSTRKDMTTVFDIKITHKTYMD